MWLFFYFIFFFIWCPCLNLPEMSVFNSPWFCTHGRPGTGWIKTCLLWKASWGWASRLQDWLGRRQNECLIAWCCLLWLMCWTLVRFWANRGSNRVLIKAVQGLGSVPASPRCLLPCWAVEKRRQMDHKLLPLNTHTHLPAVFSGPHKLQRVTQRLVRINNSCSNASLCVRQC